MQALIPHPTPPPIPANMTHWNNVGLKLAHRLRRWPNIKPTLFQCVVLGTCLFRDLGRHSYRPVVQRLYFLAVSAHFTSKQILPLYTYFTSKCRLLSLQNPPPLRQPLSLLGTQAHSGRTGGISGQSRPLYTHLPSLSTCELSQPIADVVIMRLTFSARDYTNCFSFFIFEVWSVLFDPLKSSMAVSWDQYKYTL